MPSLPPSPVLPFSLPTTPASSAQSEIAPPPYTFNRQNALPPMPSLGSPVSTFVENVMSHSRPSPSQTERPTAFSVAPELAHLDSPTPTPSECRRRLRMECSMETFCDHIDLSSHQSCAVMPTSTASAETIESNVVGAGLAPQWSHNSNHDTNKHLTDEQGRRGHEVSGIIATPKDQFDENIVTQGHYNAETKAWHGIPHPQCSFRAQSNDILIRDPGDPTLRSLYSRFGANGGQRQRTADANSVPGPHSDVVPSNSHQAKEEETEETTERHSATAPSKNIDLSYLKHPLRNHGSLKGAGKARHPAGTSACRQTVDEKYALYQERCAKRDSKQSYDGMLGPNYWAGLGRDEEPMTVYGHMTFTPVPGYTASADVDASNVRKGSGDWSTYHTASEGRASNSQTPCSSSYPYPGISALSNGEGPSTRRMNSTSAGRPVFHHYLPADQHFFGSTSPSTPPLSPPRAHARNGGVRHPFPTSSSSPSTDGSASTSCPSAASTETPKRSVKDRPPTPFYPIGDDRVSSGRNGAVCKSTASSGQVHASGPKADDLVMDSAMQRLLPMAAMQTQETRGHSYHESSNMPALWQSQAQLRPLWKQETAINNDYRMMPQVQSYPSNYCDNEVVGTEHSQDERASTVPTPLPHPPTRRPVTPYPRPPLAIPSFTQASESNISSTATLPSPGDTRLAADVDPGHNRSHTSPTQPEERVKHQMDSLSSSVLLLSEHERNSGRDISIGSAFVSTIKRITPGTVRMKSVQRKKGLAHLKNTLTRGTLSSSKHLEELLLAEGEEEHALLPPMRAKPAKVVSFMHGEGETGVLLESPEQKVLMSGAQNPHLTSPSHAPSPPLSPCLQHPQPVHPSPLTSPTIITNTPFSPHFLPFTNIHHPSRHDSPTVTLESSSDLSSISQPNSPTQAAAPAPSPPRTPAAQPPCRPRFSERLSLDGPAIHAAATEPPHAQSQSGRLFGRTLSDRSTSSTFSVQRQSAESEDSGSGGVRVTVTEKHGRDSSESLDSKDGKCGCFAVVRRWVNGLKLKRWRRPARGVPEKQ